MPNYPLYHTISKNTHVETEKENFSTSFFYFAFFLKLVFGYQKPVFPLFLRHFKSDRTENFFGDTSTNLWGIFFLSISPINQIWEDSQNFLDPGMLEIF